MNWTDIKDAPGYEINTDGQVRNSKTGRILKPHLNRPGGYLRVDLYGKHRYIHRLVADNFFGRGLNKGEKVKHIDKINKNNDPCNLRIISKNR